jgi:hypothetical protein
MKNNSIKVIISLIVVFIVSCNDPETVVTNIVHPDGSITRRIVMKTTQSKDKFRSVQIPFDNSWTMKDSIELNSKGDTTWVRRAEKLFRNVEEINQAYKSDTGSNKSFARHASYTKHFRWFYTEYRFSEIIDKKYPYGTSIKNFMNAQELSYYYSPEDMKQANKDGADSLKYREIYDTVKQKEELWTSTNIVLGWVEEFETLINGKNPPVSREYLLGRKDYMAKAISKAGNSIDSLWKSGALLNDFLGKTAADTYRSEADTAIDRVFKSFFLDLKDYSVRMILPGNIMNTNGYIDSTGTLIWPVKGDFVIGDDYEMWVVSRKPNTWAWIVSGCFVVFVMTGIILRRTKKRAE